MRTIEEIETRAKEIDLELEQPEANLEALEEEKRALALKPKSSARPPLPLRNSGSRSPRARPR